MLLKTQQEDLALTMQTVILALSSASTGSFMLSEIFLCRCMGRTSPTFISIMFLHILTESMDLDQELQYHWIQ